MRGIFLILRKVQLPTNEFGIKIVYEIVDNKIMNLLIFLSLHFMQAIPDFYFSELAQKKKATTRERTTPKSVISELFAERLSSNILECIWECRELN